MPTLKERIEALMDEKNLKEFEVAADLGMNQSRFNRIKNGITKLKQEVLEEWAAYFDVDPDYLLGKTDIRKDIKKIPDRWVIVVKKGMEKGYTPEKVEQLFEYLDTLKDDNKKSCAKFMQNFID